MNCEIVFELSFLNLFMIVFVWLNDETKLGESDSRETDPSIKRLHTHSNDEITKSHQFFVSNLCSTSTPR
jgi:hypothetical protein